MLQIEKALNNSLKKPENTLSKIGNYYTIHSKNTICIKYRDDDNLFYDICIWDVKNNNLVIPNEFCLQGDFRRKLVNSIISIRRLGYNLNKISLYNKDISCKFKRYMIA